MDAASDQSNFSRKQSSTNGASSSEQEVARKNYHRHTPNQVEELENFFKENSRPNTRQRVALSTRLGMEIKQVTFWFQNKRTLLKTQSERHENRLLKKKYEKLQAENELLRQAFANPLCHSCCGIALSPHASFEHEKLRIENAKLKHELRLVCSFSGKLLNKTATASSSATHLPPLSSSKPNLVVGGSDFPVHAQGYEASYDKSALINLAMLAMDELMRKAQIGFPLWTKTLGGIETLNQEEYKRTFAPCIGTTTGNFVTEATRETGLVSVNILTLVDILMDMDKFAYMFPAIVARAASTHIVGDGEGRAWNNVLQLVSAEYQVVSPLVPVRIANFLRFCRQQSENVWVVVDVFVDANKNMFLPLATCRKLPSGCVIQGTPDGCCQVTWIEHSEYDESGVHQLFRPVLRSGRGFGARRWLATLQRRYECLSLLFNTLPSDDKKALTMEVRTSMLQLAHRMVANLCSGICGSSLRKWEKLEVGNLDQELRIMVRKSVNDPGEPAGIVISATTSVWLPVVPTLLFEYLRNFRSHWDILSRGGSVRRELILVPNGLNIGNRVSVLCSIGAHDAVNECDMLILQETWTDVSGSMLVYAPVDVPSIEVVVGGGDPTCIQLLPSGFAITPDGFSDIGNPLITDEAPFEDGYVFVDRDASILTIGFQILVNSLPSTHVTSESVDNVKALTSSTVQKIKSHFHLA